MVNPMFMVPNSMAWLTAAASFIAVSLSAARQGLSGLTDPRRKNDW